MSTLTNTGFYVSKPCDKYWNSCVSNYVIEAAPIDTSDGDLDDWQKTNEYVQDHLKVVSPKDFGWPHVEKSMWVECSGPSRRLEFKEYVELYHSLDPERPLPKGWKEHKS